MSGVWHSVDHRDWHVLHQAHNFCLMRAGGFLHGGYSWGICCGGHHTPGCHQDQYDVHCCLSANHDVLCSRCDGAGWSCALLQVRLHAFPKKERVADMSVCLGAVRSRSPAVVGCPFLSMLHTAAGAWVHGHSATASTRQCSSASLRRCAAPSKSARPWSVSAPWPVFCCACMTPGVLDDVLKLQ